MPKTRKPYPPDLPADTCAGEIMTYTQCTRQGIRAIGPRSSAIGSSGLVRMTALIAMA